MSVTSRRAAVVTIDREPAVDHAVLSDAVLAVRARDGDPRALDALVTRHQAGVHALAAHLLRDPEDARDAAQDALVKLVSRLGQYRGEARFTTWLHRLVLNTCRDVGERQARRRHEVLPPDIANDGADDTAGQALAAASAEASRPHLRRALAGLSPAQRRVVVLRDVLAWRYDEIAAELELPLGTVKCHAHRAHVALRRRLARPRARAG